MSSRSSKRNPNQTLLLPYATAEFPPQNKELTLKGKSTSCEASIPTLKLSAILAAVLAKKDEAIEPYWDRLLAGDKLQLVIAHRDRLCRFGIGTIQYLVEQNGGELVVLDESVHSPTEELTADLLSILDVFSCQMHGLRRYRDTISEDTTLTDA